MVKIYTHQNVKKILSLNSWISGGKLHLYTSSIEFSSKSSIIFINSKCLYLKKKSFDFFSVFSRVSSEKLHRILLVEKVWPFIKTL